MRKNTTGLSLLLSFTLLLVSCSNETKNDDTPYDSQLISNENEDDGILENSIFNLTSKWHTQDNKTIELSDLKGDILVVVMIYTA